MAIAYPTLKSFITLGEGNQAEEKQWLTYWVVFGAFSIVDHFAGFILMFIPFYFVLKLAFLIWLQHPSTRGASFVYDNYLRDAVKPLDAEFERL